MTPRPLLEDSLIGHELLLPSKTLGATRRGVGKRTAVCVHAAVYECMRVLGCGESWSGDMAMVGRSPQKRRVGEGRGVRVGCMNNVMASDLLQIRQTS